MTSLMDKVPKTEKSETWLIWLLELLNHTGASHSDSSIINASKMLLTTP